jgi:hypothetical protein
MLQVTPNEFRRVQFGRVGGQVIQVDSLTQRPDELPHGATAVNAGTVPDNQQPPRQMTQQMTQKLDHLGAANPAVEELKVEIAHCQTSHHRERFPIEVVLKHRRAAPGSPGADAVRLLAQAALVDENDQPPFAERFFLMSGQRSRFQRRIACSSRSSARPTGRWQLQPSFCSSR